jgi:hypothetical protein
MASFFYRVEPEEIKQWLTEHGYALEELQWAEGAGVVGTTIHILYPTVNLDERSGEYMTAFPAQVTVVNDKLSPDYDPEVAERSIMLYRRLYRRYRSMYTRTPKNW